jgi:outer membrane protein TolC
MSGHPIPGPDPAVETWRDATEQSTGARLRDALEANHQLALDHAKRVLEVERLRADLARARQEFERLRADLARARQEIERLTARIARQPGNYRLTEKGLAAIAEPNPPNRSTP